MTDKPLQVSGMQICRKSAPASGHNQTERYLMATGLVHRLDKTLQEDELRCKAAPTATSLRRSYPVVNE